MFQFEGPVPQYIIELDRDKSPQIISVKPIKQIDFISDDAHCELQSVVMPDSSEDSDADKNLDDELDDELEAEIVPPEQWTYRTIHKACAARFLKDYSHLLSPEVRDASLAHFRKSGGALEGRSVWEFVFKAHSELLSDVFSGTIVNSEKDIICTSAKVYTTTDEKMAEAFFQQHHRNLAKYVKDARLRDYALVDKDDAGTPTWQFSFFPPAGFHESDWSGDFDVSEAHLK
jgi:hypothetical protein